MSPCTHDSHAIGCVFRPCACRLLDRCAETFLALRALNILTTDVFLLVSRGCDTTACEYATEKLGHLFVFDTGLLRGFGRTSILEGMSQEHVEREMLVVVLFGTPLSHELQNLRNQKHGHVR